MSPRAAGNSTVEGAAFSAAIWTSGGEKQPGIEKTKSRKRLTTTTAPSSVVLSNGKPKSLLAKNLLSRGDRSAQMFAPIELRSKHIPTPQV